MSSFLPLYANKLNRCYRTFLRTTNPAFGGIGDFTALIRLKLRMTPKSKMRQRGRRQPT